MRRRRRFATLIVLGLTAACATSAWALYNEVRRSDRNFAPPPVALDGRIALPEPPPAPDLTLPPITEFTAVVDRPLFLPDRRPLPADPPPPPPPKEPLAVNVVGIVMSGAQGTVLLRLPKAKDAITLRAGDVVQGWTVVDISPEGALFERDGERTMLMPRLEDPDPRRRKRRSGNAN